MPIQLSQNPYQGVNAHFNSLLQNEEGAWLTFHNQFVSRLTDAFNTFLPRGYFALSEQSLQVELAFAPPATPRPDVSIFQNQGQPSQSLAPSMQGIIPTLEIELITQETPFRAVEIFSVNPERRLITRIELLSPTNKTTPREYLDARQIMLNRGIHVIDIDFLHESPSLFREVLPSYPKQAANAYPYVISIANVRLNVVQFYCFSVDDPIPALPIPLVGTETVNLDFTAVYNDHFSYDRRAHLFIDYEQEPLNFASYSPTDQARIQAVMARVKTAES